jgi:sugar (pentulose or hexulose) kinase
VTEYYVAALDQGTTSSRCMVFDRRGRMVSIAQRVHQQFFPGPGHVEHDAEQIWRTVCTIVPEAIADAGIDPRQVVALGLTNQRETTVIWDRRTGRPVQRAIVWQDVRTADIVKAIAGNIDPAEVTAPVCHCPPTSPAPGCAGCSNRTPAFARRPNAATSCSARWTAGCYGTSPAAWTAVFMPPTSPMPVAPC